MARSGGPGRQVHEFLLFWVGPQEYGVELELVREVRGFDGVGDLPQLPPNFIGAIEWDGGLLPMMDLRIVFDLEVAVYDQFTAVLVVQVGGRWMGMVVDGVSETIALAAAELLAAPVGAAEYVQAAAANGDHCLLLLDIASLLRGPALGLADETDD